MESIRVKGERRESPLKRYLIKMVNHAFSNVPVDEFELEFSLQGITLRKPFGLLNQFDEVIIKWDEIQLYQLTSQSIEFVVNNIKFVFDGEFFKVIELFKDYNIKIEKRDL